MQSPPIAIKPNAFTFGTMLHALRKLSSLISESDMLLEGFISSVL
jgi:hypothetical protein